jgi:type VI secretion system protein ImpF
VTLDQDLRPSILDRLIAEDSGSRAIRDIRVGVVEIRRAVRRDIEWLLNTRQFLGDELERRPEARESLLTYGLPDLSQFSPGRETDRDLICTLIRTTLERFEPRFLKGSVKVAKVDAPRDYRLTSLFRISAVLYVEPISEEIIFDTRVAFDTGSVEVNEAL